MIEGSLNNEHTCTSSKQAYKTDQDKKKIKNGMKGQKIFYTW